VLAMTSPPSWVLWMQGGRQPRGLLLIRDLTATV
jgi:hypothetical protein